MGFVCIKYTNLSLFEHLFSRLMLLGCHEDECILIYFDVASTGELDVGGVEWPQATSSGSGGNTSVLARWVSKKASDRFVSRCLASNCTRWTRWAELASNYTRSEYYLEKNNCFCEHGYVITRRVNYTQCSCRAVGLLHSDEHGMPHDSA